ncbi:MAG: type II toxin-antitoxin system VapB family antitoxin [Allosphingosinicella sp.]|uniref:type II toxin-antitoxin system VapB family antitoxin n=1 Tax=Allosphingosinicella sp. TaxID=2823234 RepID=UPI00394880EA
MRTNIEIDDALVTEAMERSGARTKREAVDRALRDFVRLQRQLDILKLRGKLKWEGDLDQMRLD